MHALARKKIHSRVPGRRAPKKTQEEEYYLKLSKKTQH